MGTSLFPLNFDVVSRIVVRSRTTDTKIYLREPNFCQKIINLKIDCSYFESSYPRNFLPNDIGNYFEQIRNSKLSKEWIFMAIKNE